MSLPPFEYRAPDTVEEVIALRSEYGDDAIVMAGGLTVMVLMRERLIRPRVVVSLSSLEALRAIEVNGAASIGATATHSDVIATSALARHAPLLIDACSRVGSPAIRNMGTLGGSVSQGDGASDTAPALLALDASANLAGPDGSRQVPLAEFFEGVLTTAMGEEEVLTHLTLPEQPQGSRTRFVKYTCTSAEAFAAVTVAISVQADGDGVCRRARIGLGSVAPMPIRAHEAEERLVGAQITPALIDEVARVAAAGTDPYADGQASESYRREMTRVWVGRLLGELLLP